MSPQVFASSSLTRSFSEAHSCRYFQFDNTCMVGLLYLNKPASASFITGDDKTTLNNWFQLQCIWHFGDTIYESV